MYHLRLKGKHYDMGKKMGMIFRKAEVKFPLLLDDFQIEFGTKSGKLLKEFYPEAAEEIKGVTDIIHTDSVLFTSWLMCMGCCLYNLDAVSLIELRGCTAFFFCSGGNVYYGRDNDLPPFLRKGCKSVLYSPDNGNCFLLNTSSFINGEEGINQYGLVAAMTFVMPHLDEIKPGINSVFLVRYILEKCRNVKEAVKALTLLPIASSCNILLGDPSGNMLAVECTPKEINVRYPEKNENAENFIIAVNSFFSKKMWRYDNSDRNIFGADERYKTVLRSLKMPMNDPVRFTMDLLSGKYGFICQYNKKLDFETVWATVFDISGFSIYRAEGNPQRKKFIKDTRLKKSDDTVSA